MEKSLSCFVNKMMGAQLSPGYLPGEGGSSLSAYDLFNMLPYLAIPLLLVLIGGLYFISLYRTRGLTK